MPDGLEEVQGTERIGLEIEPWLRNGGRVGFVGRIIGARRCRDFLEERSR